MIIDGNIIKEHVKNQCRNYQEQLLSKEITIIRFNPPANLRINENLSERQKILKVKKDFRTKDGQRHSLWLVLLLVIMGTMSGYVGYRAWGDFVKRHRRVLPIEIWNSKTWCTLVLNNPTPS